MRTEPSEELAELRTQLRAFTEAELYPVAEEIDRTGKVPRRAWDLLREQGLLGLLLPLAYGGAEADLATYCMAMEEVARAHRVFTLLIDATSGLTPVGILRHGTKEQRQRFLPGLCAGTLRAAFGLTEPDTGSDAAAIKTRAERVPRGWRINGRKQWISGANEADIVMVMAVTDPSKRGRGRISAFLVERGTPGMAVTRVDTTVGSAAIELADLAFEDCVVPDAALLGEAGNGFAIAMGSLTHGRLGVSAACIGAADRLLGMSIEFAKTRHTFGAPLADRQAIQWMLADSAVEIETARAFTYDTLRNHASGRDIGPAASMCKLYCSEMVGQVADRAVQIHGGAGLVRGDFPVERFYRDVRHYRVGEGSSEIQRMLIARSLLK
ncbi:acyl-CoA dehydrogenase family protein [Roseomonas xinghualingensis]|uniref:acyl-CoA dehydrogenase family protein n=1 Tax=Roseomonas xinghualingensis TaxID=2986475 RepID=UPI0021F1FA60|nr:acyl-CoA dehydrogenase family protein [Roseomonas sp. SXEYE001]MCV4210341.1 acyl-CoA dehydrogenase family protein [Roseomonas sp. SXEYE001]